MINLVGEIIENVKVLEELPQKGIKRQFRCVCTCGNEVILDYHRLKFGRLNQCEECYQAQKKASKLANAGKHLSAPTIHTCGRPIVDHQRCKRCSIILCDEGREKNYDGYCHDCYLSVKK